MKTRYLTTVFVVICLCAAPVWAGGKRIQFGAFLGMPTDDLAEPGETLELDDATGFQGSFEFMVSDLIGVEPGLSFANHDVEVEVTGAVPESEFKLGEIDYFAITGSVNFHVLKDERIDLYLGPTIGYIFWGDLETSLFGTPMDIAADDEFAYGANVGLDVPFGDGTWSFSAGLSYLMAEITLDDDSGTSTAPDLGVDPFSLKAGVSYRF